MDEEIGFKTLTDLYVRILPALKSKVKELRRDGINYIHEEDIWNFLKNNKCMGARDLDLAGIVNDIFVIDTEELDKYVQKQIKDARRIAESGDK